MTPSSPSVQDEAAPMITWRAAVLSSFLVAAFFYGIDALLGALSSRPFVMARTGSGCGTLVALVLLTLVVHSRMPAPWRAACAVPRSAANFAACLLGAIVVLGGFDVGALLFDFSLAEPGDSVFVTLWGGLATLTKSLVCGLGIWLLYARMAQKQSAKGPGTDLG